MNTVCTVLLPVYNGQMYLKKAIESILKQTYKEFELLIINDGSTDSTDQIVRSYKDKRIRYIVNKKNIGLVETLNRGIKKASGTYIARMDADDLSHPQRLQKQIAFLSSHPDYGLVGSLFGLINEKREVREIGGAKLLGNEDLKLGLLFGNVFCHGETMFRKALFIQYNLFYDKKYQYCEDYELWTRMSRYTKFMNLPEVLYFYMTNPQGISAHSKELMEENAKRVMLKYRKMAGFPKISLPFLINLVINGRMYKDGYLRVGRRRIMAYMQLARQVYLYRLAFTCIREKRYDGALLLPASFLINPKNWFKHLFGMFPKPQDHAVQQEQA